MLGTTKSWFGVAIAACVGCCAAPLLAAFGIGGTASSFWAAIRGANLEAFICLGALGALAGGVLYLAMRKWCGHHQQSKSCEAICQTDASCCEHKK